MRYQPSTPSLTTTCSWSAAMAGSTTSSAKKFASKARGRGTGGDVEALKPEYRLALARDGYALVKSELAVLNPEE
jgi:hypothetical protein